MYEIPNNLPIGEQNFETIRTDGLLYVDKTSYIRRNK
ncbi:MAG: AAA family ATPase [Desulfovibrio sp.]|nr:AAA family ATPase [Desulfovibrio sp.]